MSKQKGFAHIFLLIVLLLGIVAGVVLIKQELIFAPKASEKKNESQEIENLTNQLIQENSNYQKFKQQKDRKIQSTDEEKKKLVSLSSIAVRRKEKLLKEIETSPKDFLIDAKLADKIDAFPESVKPYIEKKIQTQGKLTVVHVDDFKNQKSRYEYFFNESNKATTSTSYKLYFVKDPPKVFSGSEIRLEGVRLDQQVVLATGNAQSNQTGLRVIAAATLPPALGEQKTTVLLVNFSDNPNAKPVTKEQIQDLVFSTANPKSVNNYYKENSFNKMYLTGDVFGWYTIEYTTCNWIDDVFRMANLVNEAFAKESGFPISNQYKRVLYVFSNPRCFPNARAWGTIGGSPISQAWLVWYGTIQQNISIYAHELGHNLGTHHANRWPCPLGVYTDCSEYEYGDKYDVMGQRFEDPLFVPIPHFNAPHKVSVGWLDEIGLMSVTQDGTYTIAPLEDSQPRLKVIRFRKPDTNEYYFISYRQGIGFDQNSLDFEISNGASIHIWNEDSFRQTKYLSNGIYSNNPDLALADGKVFYDQANQISVKQISHVLSTSGQAGSVTVEIKFNGGVLPIPTPISGSTPQPSPTNLPSPSPSPSPIPSPTPISKPSPKAYTGKCVQVITRACAQVDPRSCYDFPTPCSVPDGWVRQ